MWNISHFKNNWEKYDKNAYWSSCYSCPILKNLEFVDMFLKSTQLWNFLKISPVVAELFQADGQKDRQFDRHNEANSHFLQLCELVKKINMNLNFNAVNFLSRISKSDTLHITDFSHSIGSWWDKLMCSYPLPLLATSEHWVIYVQITRQNTNQINSQFLTFITTCFGQNCQLQINAEIYKMRGMLTASDFMFLYLIKDGQISRSML